MSDDIKVGDRVAWTSSGGKSVGRVKKKLTKPMEIEGHHVAASAEDPEFLVQSDKSGGRAAHKPAALKKAASPASASKKTTKKKTAAKKAAATKTTAKKAASKNGAAKKSVKR